MFDSLLAWSMSVPSLAGCAASPDAHCSWTTLRSWDTVDGAALGTSIGGVMPKCKKLCGDRWRHDWQTVKDRKKCRRCKKINPVGVPNEIRFWDHVKKTRGCWIYTGFLNHDGYGLFSLSRVKPRKTVTAHRYAWLLTHGWLPDYSKDQQFDHLCRTRACVNPDHLELVTHAENIRRSPHTGVCKRGHRIEGDNAYYYSTGRKCRKCLKANRKVK